MCRRENERVNPGLARRGCARLVDCLMALVLWCAAERLLTGGSANKNLGMVLCDLTIAVFIACLYEVFLIAWTGTTIGKRLFGIYVLHRDRGRLSISASFTRTYAIWRTAFGYGIPFVRFVRLVRLRHGAERGVALPWDGETGDWMVEWRNSGKMKD